MLMQIVLQNKRKSSVYKWQKDMLKLYNCNRMDNFATQIEIKGKGEIV